MLFSNYRLVNTMHISEKYLECINCGFCWILVTNFRRGCLSATRWTTQFKSLINKGLYSPEKSFTAKVLIDGTMLLYLFNDMPSKVQVIVICLCSSHYTG